MIVDCILSRYEKSRENGSYYSESFRNRIADYIYEDISDADEIVDAMDNGNEQEVKATLITYLIDNKYNPRIIDYVLSVDWLKDILNEQPSVIDLDVKPANEQEYQKQIKHYKQIVNDLTGKNTYGINNDAPKIEMGQEQRRIVYNYYERLCKERNSDDRPIRYSVIEYLCSFPKINPVYMAHRLANSGYEIAFDDTSISQSANNRKRMEVFNYEYRKRKGLGTTIPMFLEEPTSKQENNNIKDTKNNNRNEIEDDYEREEY